jgi:UDP-N-acetylmuramyl pentapeptide phosphotransferase/UDP-N-acetylglucosamine-1-phosphate transferase
MVTALVFVVAMVVSLVVTPLVRHFAHSRGILDQPDPRKVHTVPIPRLGGIAMVLAFGVAIGAAMVSSATSGRTERRRSSPGWPSCSPWASGTMFAACGPS